MISEEKGQCYRVLGPALGPALGPGPACSLPILRNITRQICCCSRVGKAWGAGCLRCPYFGSGESSLLALALAGVGWSRCDGCVCVFSAQPPSGSCVRPGRGTSTRPRPSSSTRGCRSSWGATAPRWSPTATTTTRVAQLLLRFDLSGTRTLQVLPLAELKEQKLRVRRFWSWFCMFGLRPPHQSAPLPRSWFWSWFWSGSWSWFWFQQRGRLQDSAEPLLLSGQHRSLTEFCSCWSRCWNWSWFWTWIRCWTWSWFWTWSRCWSRRVVWFQNPSHPDLLPQTSPPARACQPTFLQGPVRNHRPPG